MSLIKLNRQSVSLFVAALALVYAMPHRTNAIHPILVTSGRIRLESNELVVWIMMDTNSPGHEIEGHDDADRAERMARDLSKSLVLLDQEGNRIEPRSVSVVPASSSEAASPPENHDVQCVIKYPLAAGVRLVVFQYRLSGDSPFAHRQIQLTPVDEHGQPLGLLRLSTGGNIDLIAIDDTVSDQRILRRAENWIEKFQVPHITTRIVDRELVVEVNMPAPLLRTWISLARRSIDVIDREDVDDARQTLRTWFDRQLLITMNGKAASPAATQLSLQTVSHDLITNRETDSACFWISSIKFVARFPCPDAGPVVDLTWRGFNGAVLQAIAEVVAGDANHAPITLTPSTPSLRILPGDFTSNQHSPR